MEVSPLTSIYIRDLKYTEITSAPINFLLKFDFCALKQIHKDHWVMKVAILLM